VEIREEIAFNGRSARKDIRDRRKATLNGCLQRGAKGGDQFGDAERDAARVKKPRSREIMRGGTKSADNSGCQKSDGRDYACERGK